MFLRCPQVCLSLTFFCSCLLYIVVFLVNFCPLIHQVWTVKLLIGEVVCHPVGQLGLPVPPVRVMSSSPDSNQSRDLQLLSTAYCLQCEFNLLVLLRCRNFCLLCSSPQVSQCFTTNFQAKLFFTDSDFRVAPAKLPVFLLTWGSCITSQLTIIVDTKPLK